MRSEHQISRFLWKARIPLHFTDDRQCGSAPPPIFHKVEFASRWDPPHQSRANPTLPTLRVDSLEPYLKEDPTSFEVQDGDLGLYASSFVQTSQLFFRGVSICSLIVTPGFCVGFIARPEISPRTRKRPLPLAKRL